jgi:hypothetical protein
MRQNQDLDSENSNQTRTAKIQLRQSVVGLERFDQCICTCIANQVAWYRTHSARHHSLTPEARNNHKTIHTACSQDTYFEHPAISGCGWTKSPLHRHRQSGCLEPHSLSTVSPSPSPTPQAHINNSIDRSCQSRTNKIQPLQSAVGQECQGQCLSTGVANLVPCDCSHSAPFVAFNKSHSSDQTTGHAPSRYSAVNVQ